MIYAKYEFDTLPDLSEINGSVVKLGHLLITEGVYSEDGEVITAPIMSDGIAVDILYHTEIIQELEPYRLYPKTPKHFIGGQQELYYSTLQTINT